MTVSNGTATTTSSTIESLDAFARQLYRRTRAAGHDFSDIATVVRGLHRVLKHLRVEAEDPDSLLNPSNPTGNNRDSLYARQLTPIVEDCDFTLKQLETILEKYGGAASGDSEDDVEQNSTDGSRRRHNGRRSKEVESREKDMIALIRTKLANQKTNIDIFLDTVQLHNPIKARRPLQNPDDQQLDAIKDQVDEIATRLFHRRGAVGGEDDEELWQQFRTELEKAGFSSEVLRRNKEVLRAYIRELDSHDVPENGAPPSVRGLLDNGSAEAQPMTITPASYLDNEAVSPKESFRSIDNEKFSPDVKNARRFPGPAPQPLDPRVPQSLQPYYRSQPPALYNQQSSGLSFEQHHSSDSSDTDSHSSQEMAIISTRDLMTMDHRAAELIAARMGAMHLGLPPNQPPNYSYTPGNRYLPAAHQPLPIMAAEAPAALPPTHQLSTSPNTQQLLGTSPRYVPPLYPPEYSNALSPTSSTMTPPPAYGSSPTMPTFPSSAPTSGIPAMPQRYSRLAPDDKGKEIPLDAKWTRIKRTLVSPVVLEKAGVRYEARPEYVAVLGVLSREQIEKFARESAEVRNARRGGGEGRKNGKDCNQRRDRDMKRDREQFPVRSSRRNETYNDRDRRRQKESESSDSDSDVLWDESDTTEDEKDDKRRYRRDRRSGRDRSPDEKEKDRHRDSSETGTRFIPIIVPPPGSTKGRGDNDKLSPTATVGPKPILKNKNTNHVRFGADGPREVSSDDFSRSPRPKDHHDRDHKHRHRNERDHDRDKDRDRPRDRLRRDGERDRDRDLERDKDRERERDKDHEHHHHRHHGRDRDRDRERDRDRDREREREREKERDRPRDRDRDRDGDRERDRDRDKDYKREDKAAKKSALRETLGAVGIGGAAASLLSVLTEAATGL